MLAVGENTTRDRPIVGWLVKRMTRIAAGERRRVQYGCLWGTRDGRDESHETGCCCPTAHGPRSPARQQRAQDQGFAE